MKKNRIFIHIGVHKTGTTYLQNNFFKSLRQVEIINSPRFYQEIAKSPYDKDKDFLLSNEGISGVAWNYSWLLGKENSFHWIDSFYEGIKKIKVLYPSAIILIFFRKHGDLLVSMYKQYVQEGGTLKIMDFYGNDKLIRDIDLSYSTRINTLQEKFNNVYILNYEEFRNNGDDYLWKFFKEFGIKMNLVNNDDLAKNRSISGKKIDILRFINQFYIRLPLNIRKGLRKLKISPRHIVQNYLSFWKSPDSEDYIKLRNEINNKFNSDWDYFETMKWNYKKD